MASIFDYKVFNKAGEYIASCKHVEDAAVIVSVQGNGASIRLKHRKTWTLWMEGAELQPAGESYDFVATTANERLKKLFPGVIDYEAQARSDAASEQTIATVLRMLAEIPR